MPSDYYIALSAFATPDYVSDPQPTVSDESLTYKDAGVDIDAGNELVERIKPLVKRTQRPEVLAGLGGFGGLFALPPGRYREPVLVSGTDGVGTKLKLAQHLDVHDTIGVDLVAMCVNDVLVQGAEPLFFLDYFACGRLDIDVATDVIAGIADGCSQAGAALIGGETAEMPDMYAAGEYDLAGFCVGVVERDGLLDGGGIRAGDALIGIASSGPHSNGYSLIRKILERDADAVIEGIAARQRLIEPTRIYVKPVMALMQGVDVRGLAHITGGGITENVPRMLRSGLGAEIDTASWDQDPVFDWLAKTGNVSSDEMRRTFNCGVGMIVAVAPDARDRSIDILTEHGERAWQIGTVTDTSPGVRYV